MIETRRNISLVNQFQLKGIMYKIEIAEKKIIYRKRQDENYRIKSGHIIIKELMLFTSYFQIELICIYILIN